MILTKESAQIALDELLQKQQSIETQVGVFEEEINSLHNKNDALMYELDCLRDEEDFWRNIIRRFDEGKLK